MSNIQTVEREAIGEYKLQQQGHSPLPFLHLTHEDFHLTDEDKELLLNFFRNRSQTMGDILTLNNNEGSKIISCLEKLVDLGFLKRDWEKEVESGEKAVYSITPEGRYIAEKSARH